VLKSNAEDTESERGRNIPASALDAFEASDKRREEEIPGSDDDSDDRALAEREEESARDPSSMESRTGVGA